MKAKATVRFILIGALLVLGLSVAPLTAAELKDVRVGTYDTFTRIVFQFDGPVRFDKPVTHDQGVLTVKFLNANTALSDQSLKSKSKGLTSLRISPQATNLKADVGLPFDNMTIKAFALKEPDRIVVDVYETQPPPARITIKDVVIKNTQQSAPPAPSKTQTAAANVPETRAAATPPKPVATPPKPAAPPPVKAKAPPPAQAAKPAPQPTKQVKPVVKQQPPKQAVPEKKPIKTKVKEAKQKKSPFLSKNIQRYLTIALIFIGCAIVVLIGFILVQKRRAPKPAQHSQTEHLLESTEEVLSAIDEKIKEKLHKLK